MLTPVPNCAVVFSAGLMTAINGQGKIMFAVGPGTYLTIRGTRDYYHSLLTHQRMRPVLVGAAQSHQYWRFRNTVYCETEGLQSEHVYALLVAAEMEHQHSVRRRIDRAQAMVAQGPRDSQPTRGHISVETRSYVFQRDGGKCTVCASTVELQFDHIIPVKLGGSDEPENLQVLCGPCNRRKGATLG